MLLSRSNCFLWRLWLGLQLQNVTNLEMSRWNLWSILSFLRYFKDVEDGGVDSTPSPCFLAFSCSFGQSEHHFQRKFFILSPTSTQNLRFSSKMQKQSFMGTKIAQKGLFFKTFEKFGFLVVNLVGIDTTFEKKISQFSKTGPWGNQKCQKNSCFL